MTPTRLTLTWLTVACLILPSTIAARRALPAGFTEAPIYVPLFTPRGVPPGTYRTFTSAQDLDAIVTALRREPEHATPGRFEPRLEIVADAFGQSGGYNRWKVALLYGAKRVKVARGPRVEQGRVVEAWTLLSPYPDPALETLNPGTLLIVLRLQP